MITPAMGTKGIIIDKMSGKPGRFLSCKLELNLPGLSLACIALSFILYKWSHLSLPCYYDESWVYYPAIRYMYENGLSSIFDASAVEYLRGHPVLFHVLGMIWMKVIGTSAFSIHVFALAFFASSLFIIFRLLRKYSNVYVETGLILAINFQSNFIIQSSLALPELVF